MDKRDMSGILFKNDRKESEKHPDYTGNATIHGKDFWMSAWIKTGKKGKFMSFAFKPKEEKKASGRVPGKVETEIDLDDSVPF